MTDKAIVHMRRMLLAMARQVRDGKEPEIPALTSDYREVRSAAATIARGDDWWERLYGAASASSLEKAD
jgi:phthalate 4,5-dioxygenase oxygenase subunit